jgi:hypothetical protein
MLKSRIPNDAIEHGEATNYNCGKIFRSEYFPDMYGNALKDFWVAQFWQQNALQLHKSRLEFDNQRTN